MQTKVKAITQVRAAASSKLKDFKLLVKFRLSATVVFSAVMAFLIAGTGSINWIAVMVLALGGFFVTAASNALNEVLEKDYDRLMKRTADRPLATGRMSVADAVLIAGVMGLSGITLLAMFNPWSALFGTLALMTYAFVYTPLKRVSPIAITVGAVAGALPMLIGCVAIQGELTWLAFTLFALQFMWQFPHFEAIGWLAFEDYKKAGYKLFQQKENGERTDNMGLSSMIYALLLVPIGCLPFFLGVCGITSAIITVILSLVYAWFGWNLYKKQTRKAALQLMFSSFFYLPLVLAAMYFDKV